MYGKGWFTLCRAWIFGVWRPKCVSLEYIYYHIVRSARRSTLVFPLSNYSFIFPPIITKSSYNFFWVIIHLFLPFSSIKTKQNLGWWRLSWTLECTGNLLVKSQGFLSFFKINHFASRFSNPFQSPRHTHFCGEPGTCGWICAEETQTDSAISPASAISAPMGKLLCQWT